MSAAFLLDDTAISGIARMTMALADALVARGEVVKIVTTGTPVTWRNSRAEWIFVDDFREFPDAAFTSADVRALGPIVDDEVFRDRLPREHDPLRVLLAGASHLESHGVDDGYGAAAHARWFHQTLELIRVSPWVPSREEPLDAVQEFHVGLTTAEMTRLMHSCDVFLAPNPETLTACEAMAAGLACVFMKPEDSAVDFGETLIEALSDAAVRTRLRERGRGAAERFRVERALSALRQEPPL